MNRRIKKKHRLKYWLRSPKEERQAFREFLQMFSTNLTHEEIAECIKQGTEDAKKELEELEEQEHE